MDAVVTAGGVPLPGDPLYEYTQGQPKALLDICGKPMIQWVLDALSQSRSVDRIVVVGLPSGSGIDCPNVAAYLPGQGGMLQNVAAGVSRILQIHPAARHVLAVSSDIPAITPEMVDWMVQAVGESDEDLYYNLITRQVMEARFPNSNRSYIRLKDAEVCGGDMNAISTLAVSRNDALWEQIIAARKNALKQASLIGYDTLLLLLLRRITIEQGVRRAAKRLKISGRAILCPYAEVGMDVDKPHQLALIRDTLSKRTALQAKPL